jgi:hypothetical protein
MNRTRGMLAAALLVACGDFPRLEPMCPMAPCDIYLQCGCDGSQTPVCDLDLSRLLVGGTACRIDTLGGEESQSCTVSTSCAAGYSCIAGRCMRYCRTDDDCSGAGGLCVIHPTVDDQPIPGIAGCTTDCVPSQVDNSSCPDGWACHIYVDISTGRDRYLTDCSPAPNSGGIVGSNCSLQSDCTAGLDCVTLSPGNQQCRPNCVCEGTSCNIGVCPAETGTCIGYATPVSIGDSIYGVCY